MATSPNHCNRLLEISPYKVALFSIECLSTSEKQQTTPPLSRKGYFTFV